MAGRKAGFRHSEETRQCIQAAQLINRLEEHVFADAPLLDASQVNAAKALLAKVLPDLKAVEHSGDIGVRKEPADMTDDELAAIAAAGSAGAS